MSRLTPEREFQIRNDSMLSVDYLVEVLEELDAVRRERDEAIVGAYRAAADVSITLVPGAVPIHPADYWQEAILDLTPQSALDAVERDRRELIWTAIEMQRNDDCDYVSGNIEPCGDKEYRIDRVIAKVKRA